MNRGNKLKKIVQNLIIIICLCSFSFFAYKLYIYNKEEKQQEKLRDSLLKTAITNNVQSRKQNNTDIQEQIPINIDFNTLKKVNKDIVAWIYSEGTPINYPIAQANDNEYYLRRLLDKTYNPSGTIFIDCKNNSDFEDYNTIIYGHNMKNDTMFGTLTNYKKQEYFKEHPYMYLFTENKNFKIELFAGYTTTSESDIYSFPKTSEKNEKLIKTAMNNSTFKSQTEVKQENKIVTLSTCSYDFESARYVLLGILKEVQ